MVVIEAGGGAPPPGDEARDGVTPAMRNARARHFRPPVTVSPDAVAKVEADLLAILNVPPPPPPPPHALPHLTPSCVHASVPM